MTQQYLFDDMQVDRDLREIDLDTAVDWLTSAVRQGDASAVASAKRVIAELMEAMRVS